MGPEIPTFDQYWAAFVLEHWRPSTRRLLVVRTGVGLGRLVLDAVALARRGSPAARARLRTLRWGMAATLLTWGKVLAGTMDDEIERVIRAAAPGWPPLEAPAPCAGEPEVDEPSRATDDPAQAADRAWAAWL